MIDELANTAKQVPVSMNIQVSGVRLSKDSLHMVNSPLCVVIGLVNKKREEKRRESSVLNSTKRSRSMPWAV